MCTLCLDVKCIPYCGVAIKIIRKLLKCKIEVWFHYLQNSLLGSDEPLVYLGNWREMLLVTHCINSVTPRTCLSLRTLTMLCMKTPVLQPAFPPSIPSTILAEPSRGVGIRTGEANRKVRADFVSLRWWHPLKSICCDICLQGWKRQPSSNRAGAELLMQRREQKLQQLLGHYFSSCFLWFLIAVKCT